MNLNEIRRNFSIGLKKIGFKFDEDIFIDACMRCDITLGSRIMTKQECIKYLWVAYKNVSKNFMHKKYTNSIEEPSIIIEEDYSNDIDRMYNIIKEEVSKKFGESICSSWLDKECNGKSYEELRILYGDRDYIKIFKEIKSYIKTILPQINKEFKELLVENGFRRFF